MEKAIVVRGKLTDARHIELDEPVNELDGPVDVVLRRVPSDAGEQRGDVFNFIAQLPAGTRSKEEIDRQLREERASWGDR